MTDIRPGLPDREPKLYNAIDSLYPNCQWALRGFDYDGLEWLEPPVYEGGTKKPTREELENELTRLKNEWEVNKYQKLRELEYPDFREYLDAIVKGDQDQMKAYIDACLAVKEKYPKLVE